MKFCFRKEESLRLLRCGVFIISAILAFVMDTRPSYAQEVWCERAEQSGCLELQFLLLVDNPKNTKMQDLISRRKTNRDLALSIYHEDVKKEEKMGEERARLHSPCVDKLVYVWKANSEVSLARMRQYDSLEEPSSVSLHENPTSIPFLEEGGGFPTHIFKTEVCDGMGGLQFPRDFLGDDSYILVCSLEDTVFPYQPLSPKALRNGFWFVPEDIQRIKRNKLVYELMVFIYKEAKSKS